ncbi:MAG: SUMF1/EgtB/PvdO family nonheme iron enzyme [Acidobacteriota bacterium]|nr:SUMF1/EgtB/PvdO family nonheme iron enzyme [Acidobacteriota bacterium]
MPNSPAPAAFISYVRRDDEHEGGKLVELCERLAEEVRMQSGEEFPLFVDRKNIGWGEAWKERIDGALDATSFLIPIITPSYFKRKACREELERFAEREKRLREQGLLGPTQLLILPIYYLRTPLLESEEKRADDPLAQLVASRQRGDWRDLRHEELGSKAVNERLAEFAEQICEALEELGDFSAEAPAAASPELLPAEVRYLRRVAADCDRLPLAEEAREVGDRKLVRPSLGRVYVELETTLAADAALAAGRLGVAEEPLEKALKELWQEEGKGPRGFASGDGSILSGMNRKVLERLSKQLGRKVDPQLLSQALKPLSVRDALGRFRSLVLLGDPGSGKSTFINHLTHRRAQALLGDDDQAAGFPLRVLLRKWHPPENGQEEPAEGAELIYRLLEQSVPGLERDRLLERLEDEDTLVILDGLDEVPAAEEAEEDRRRKLVAAVESLAVAHPCRLLVTCRVKPYEDPAYQLESFIDVTLAPLDDERIRTFVHRWYEELARIGRLQPEDAEERRERLLQALGDRPVLRQMAETPLLLTMLARVNARAVLPDNRAELYRECVEQLLWEWERQKSEGGLESLVSLLEEPGVDLDRADVERVLWRLTYAAHGGEADAQIGAGRLREALAEIHPRKHHGWSWASRVVELMRERGGLLVEKEIDTFSFPHRSFQEYLAARWLLEEENWTVEARKLASRDTWREVLLLACGHLRSQGSYQDVQTLLSELIEGVEGPEEGAAAEGAAVRLILLAGAVWVEFGPHRAVGETGKRLRQSIPELLQPVMVHKEVAQKQRLEAGLALSDLGVLPEDLDDWVEIPADALEYSFKIGKYPVTNAQFRRFVEAGGYNLEREWWSEEAKREIVDFEQKFGEGEWPQHPRLWGNRTYNRANLPVVGVSWYEAQAYCAWRTRELRAAGKLLSGEEIRLPTLAEWQRAAGGAEGQLYPWGKDFEAWRANTEESGLGRPSPVSMYPGGVSAEGAWDLAGNVWEWSLEKDDNGLPWLKGGTFYWDSENAKSSARFRYHPYDWIYNVVFRCVCSPVSRAGSES